MKRRTLDMVFVAGGVLLAVLLGVLGLVMKANADFAKDYVKDQLSQQQINFTPAAALSPEEAASSCLVEFAGTPLDSGPKAECYANDYIALHMSESATTAGYPGATYATLGAITREIRTELTAATEAGNPTDEIQARVDAATTLRESMFKGETLRGLLLTSYGFSVFGEKGSQVETVAFIAALVLLLASLAGLVHFARTPKDKVVHLGHVEANGSVNGAPKTKVLVGS
jgi:hypothetical protein